MGKNGPKQYFFQDISKKNLKMFVCFKNYLYICTEIVSHGLRLVGFHAPM